ncbi:MAG: efflux RND transporter periplasmic adaptor subunit [Terriglobia bacterium]
MNRRYPVFTLLLLAAGCSRKTVEPAAEPHHDEKEKAVEIGLEAQKHVGLKVAPAALNQMTEYLQVTGTVQPIDSKVVHLRPLAKGRLIDVMVRLGDRVAAGQALARFDNIEAGEAAAALASARAELQRLRVQLAAQTRQAERQKRLSEIGAVPAKDHEAILAEQQGTEEVIRSQESTISGLTAKLRRFGVSEPTPGALVTTPILSPFTGVVTKIEAAPGAVVDSEDQMFTIADLSRVWVQAEVYEKDLGRVRFGQPAFIRVDTYPDARFSGTVSYISDILDAQTRTARVRCEVANPGARLKLDMFATVELPTTFRRMAINVPASAIQQLDGKNVVFVRQAPTQFEVRRIEVGNQVRDQVEVTSGLREGEPVAIQGAFHLKSILAGKELGESH